MTLEEKEHKIKLIFLIIIVEQEKLKKNTNGINGYLNIVFEIGYWIFEFEKIKNIRVKKIIPFKSGAAIVGNNINKEIIIK